MANSKALSVKTPMLEWIAGGVGLTFLLAFIAIIGSDAIDHPADSPARITVQPGAITKTGDGYVVVFETSNSGGDAAGLQVEGELSGSQGVIETSTATIDYVPGKGSAMGGLFFEHDPAEATLHLRPLGYQAP